MSYHVEKIRHKKRNSSDDYQKNKKSHKKDKKRDYQIDEIDMWDQSFDSESGRW